MVEAHGAVRYICNLCDDFSLTNIRSLKRHKYLVHQTNISNQKIEMEVFECDLCDEQFNMKSKLNIHVQKIHTKFKPKICEICGKGFRENDKTPFLDVNELLYKIVAKGYVFFRWVGCHIEAQEFL